jgi:hypothetical protein
MDDAHDRDRTGSQAAGGTHPTASLATGGMPLTAAANERVVLDVLSERYGLPLDHVAAGETRVVELPSPTANVQAFAFNGGIIAGARPELVELVRAEMTGGPSGARAAMGRIAAHLGGRPLAVANRTGVTISPPAVRVEVTDAADPRLPEWVRGYFTGAAWVVADDDGRVLSTAVLKRYDDRLREISVGTDGAARGRGLARAVVAAAARAVLAEGRAVLYNHEIDNTASARVAESVGLHELGILHTVLYEGSRER